jgi:hypothetical protein
MYYNSCRVQQTLMAAPVMATGLPSHIRSIEKLISQP